MSRTHHVQLSGRVVANVFLGTACVIMFVLFRLATSAGAAGAPVELMPSPEASIQPQAVTDGSGTLHLLTYRGDPAKGDLYYTTRRSTSKVWSAPIRVNSRPNNAVAMGTIRGGQLAIGKGNRPHVVWFGAGSGGSGHGMGAPLNYSRLNDRGTAFEPSRDLMQGTQPLDGGPSVAADDAGRVYVVWHANAKGEEGEGDRRVWISASLDEGKTFSAPKPVWNEPTGACACCSTKVFADSKGAVYILYRSAKAQVNRDMYLLTAAGPNQPFKGTKIDNWRINACPMSSESFVEGPGAILAGWETNGQVSYTRINPANKSASTPIAAPGSGPNRKYPALAVNGAGDTLLAWSEGTAWSKGGDLVWQVFDKSGKPTSRKGRVDGGIPTWSLPTAVAQKDGSFLLIH